MLELPWDIILSYRFRDTLAPRVGAPRRTTFVSMPEGEALRHFSRLHAPCDSVAQTSRRCRVGDAAC